MANKYLGLIEDLPLNAKWLRENNMSGSARTMDLCIDAIQSLQSENSELRVRCGFLQKDVDTYEINAHASSDIVERLRKERDDLIAAIKKSDDEYLTLRKECDDLKRALSSMSIYAVELEQRLAGQVPDERGSQYLTADELADPEYMRAYIDEMHSIIKDIAKHCPTSEATTTQPAADARKTADPQGFLKCTHPDCGRYWTESCGGRWECRAMRDNACARNEQPAADGGGE